MVGQSHTETRGGGLERPGGPSTVSGCHSPIATSTCSAVDRSRTHQAAASGAARARSRPTPTLPALVTQIAATPNCAR
jgi:hypothetical protein